MDTVYGGGEPVVIGCRSTGDDRLTCCGAATSAECNGHLISAAGTSCVYLNVDQCIPPSDPAGEYQKITRVGGDSSTGIIIAAAGGAVLLLVFVIILVVVLMKKKKPQVTPSPVPGIQVASTSGAKFDPNTG